MARISSLRDFLHVLAVMGFLGGVGSPALAAGEKGSYAVKGAGLGTCERYVADRSEKSEAYYLYVGWLTGYLTGYNRYAEDTVDIVPWQSAELLAALMENHCRKHPSTLFAVATNEMIAALVPHRLRTVSEKVTVGDGQQRIVLYEAILLRVQQALSERGHYSGPIDGTFNDETRTALTKFQEERSLEKSGLPDQRTLLSLFQ